MAFKWNPFKPSPSKSEPAKPAPAKPAPTPAPNQKAALLPGQQGPSLPSKTSQPGGTYNPTTGIYTSPTGNKQSMPTAPTGATIVGAPSSQTKYVGGGTIRLDGGGSVTMTPVQPQQSIPTAIPENINQPTLTPSNNTLAATQMERARNTQFSWFNLGGYLEAKAFIYIPAYRNWALSGPTMEQASAKNPILVKSLMFTKGVTDFVPASMFFSPLTQTGIQQQAFNQKIRVLETQEVITKAGKLPYIGTRTLKDSAAQDIFYKKISTQGATLESGGIVNMKMTGGTSYKYGGGTTTKITTTDLVSTFTSPKTYTDVQSKVIGGTGRLLPTKSGITPSFGKLNVLEPKSTELFGGRTATIKDYTLSQSGKLTRMDITGPTESGVFDIKIQFSKEASAILKMQTNKDTGMNLIKIQRGNMNKYTSTSQSTFTATKNLPIISPKIATQASTKEISIFSNTAATSAILNIGAASQTQTKTSNKQDVLLKNLPAIASRIDIGTKNIPVTTTRFSNIPRTNTVPITTPITVPRMNIGSGTSSMPFTGGFTPNIPLNFTPVIPFAFGKMPSLDFGSVGGKVKAGKRRSKYTPSFGALVFGIRGKAPKGLETGARIRPIPKNYSWAFSRMNLPSIRTRIRRRRR